MTTDDSLAAAARRQDEEPQPWQEGILTATLGNADTAPEIPEIQAVPLGPRQHLFLMGGIPWASVPHVALEALALRAVAHDEPSAAARLALGGCHELLHRTDAREAYQLERNGAVLVVRGS